MKFIGLGKKFLGIKPTMLKNKNDTGAIVTKSTHEEIEYVHNSILKFNAEQVPLLQKDPFIYLNYVVKNGDQVLGGVKAILYNWNILFINVLWVDNTYRHHGYGSALMQKVEQEAKNSGSTLAHVDTFDFQAKDFYIKNGYEIFGILKDCPPGHERYYLKKAL
jgi:ribosomal protein S18 acetylase RimI-like enzyme